MGGKRRKESFDKRKVIRISNNFHKRYWQNLQWSLKLSFYCKERLDLYCNRSDFNDVYNVCIIENCSPGRLDVKENKYIHLFNSLRPHGLNTVNPFGLRLIN